MYSWRITKYNPIFRDESGVYLEDEWTSITRRTELEANKKLGRYVAATAYDTRTRRFVVFAGEPRSDDNDEIRIYPDTVRMLVLGTEENKKNY